MTTNPLAPYVQHHEFCAGRMLRQADRSFKFEGCNCGLSQALEAQETGMTEVIRAGNAMYDELESYFSPDSGTPNLKRAFDLLAAWDAATAKARPEK